MKKLLVWLLAVGLCLTCVGCELSTESTPTEVATSENTTTDNQPVESLEFKQLPDDVSNLELDMDAPIDNLIKGAWIESVMLDDTTTFDMYDYIPETAQVCEKAILIVLESGVKPDEFIVSSGWKEIADTNNATLLIVPNDTLWTEDEKAVEKIGAAFAAAKARHYYDVSWDLLNLVGYGDGATVSMQYVMSAPDNFASVVFFGGDPVPQEYINTVSTQPSMEEGIAKSEVKCPVWIFADELTAGVEAEIEYWKHANNNDDCVYTNSYADAIYLPSSIYHGMQLDDSNIAQTRVTIGKNVDGTGAELLQVVYDDFLWVYARHRGIGNQELRYYLSPQDYGMELHTAIVDGLRRYWYVYVPESVKNSGEPAPLVVSMAGRGGSNTTFPSLTDWPLIANERNFICAFPIAGYGRQLENGVGNIPMWNSQVDDVAFIDYMVKDVKANYPIDASRVYANGQSMGSMMSLTLNVCLPNVFAATGSTCFPLPQDALSNEYYNEQIDCPAWVIFGDSDTTIGSYKMSENDNVMQMIDYYVDRYDLCSVEDAQCYRSGPFSHYVFTNDEGIPMFRYSVVDNKGHANLPSESLLLYDEFFSRFYRDEDGTLHYMDSEDVLDIR